MWEVLLDALLDGLKILPFIFLIYLLMEAIENARKKEKIEKALSGAGAPLVAGLLGAVPECGFAVMCAKLYDKGLIKIGTLIAAFISISDEGVIILLSSGKVSAALLVMGVKILYAVAVGEVINLLLAKKDETHVCPEKDSCIECGKHNENPWDKYLLHPLFHTAKTFLYVLVINIAFGTAFYFIGEENVIIFMDRSEALEPVFSGIIGIIPNCASSIFLAKGYIDGMIGFAGLTAGLSANAGIAVTILLRNRKNLKKTAFIVFLLYLLSVLLGYITLIFLKIL